MISNTFDDSARNLEKNIREDAYASIEEGISNDKLKEELEKIIKLKIKNTSQYINLSIKANLKEYEKNIKNDLGRFIRYIKDIEEITFQTVNSNIACNIYTKSGIKWVQGLGGVVGLLGASFLIAANIWNPIGWLMTIAGLISISKAIFQFFSKSYKKAQQRKSVDENLKKNMKKFQEEILNNKKEIACKIKVENNKIEYKIDSFVESVSNQLDIIIIFQQALQKIQNAI